MYEKILLFASPVFLLLIGIECVVARLRHRSEYRLGDALAAIGLGALSTYVGVFTRLFSFGIYVALFEHHRLFSLDRGSAWVWVSGLVLYDFLYYWNHRLGHEVAILWAAHVVHHQGEEFNLSTALRQTGTGFLLSWVFYVPMVILGYPPEVFLVLSLIDLLYQFWIHTEQIGSLGVFDRIFASPSNHRVHHAVNDLYVDRNYGGILILWDRLFGSFQPELPTLPPVYGTRDPLRSWNPLWANVHSYWTLLRGSWRARRWSDRPYLPEAAGLATGRCRHALSKGAFRYRQVPEIRPGAAAVARRLLFCSGPFGDCIRFAFSELCVECGHGVVACLSARTSPITVDHQRTCRREAWLCPA